MDPVSAVGLAASILQLIHFGAEVTQRLADFSKVVNETPKAFRQIKTVLPLILDGLRRIERNIDAGKVDKETQDALVPVVNGCMADTELLQEILEKALPASDSSSWDRKMKALKSLHYDNQVEKIAESLQGYVSTLTFHQVIDNFHNLRVEPKEPPQRSKPLWLVPFDRNPSFIGRDGIFAEMETIFAVPKGTQPKAALYGLGGIGKSQVALEYCHRKRKTDYECSIFWVNAATVARFEESYNHIAAECGLVTHDDGSSDAAIQLKNWLEARHERPWLMVVDNIDDEDAFFRQHMRIGKTPFECIPRCQQGCLLFTTRNRDIAFDVATPTHPILVHGMDREEGMRLIERRLTNAVNDPLISELLDVLENIPMAINQAVAFMVKRRKSISQYLELYRKDDAIRSKLLSYEFSDHGRQANSLESVAKTWMISFGSIRQSNPRAADMLCLIAFFQHQSIPGQLLQLEDEDEFDFDDAVAILKAFSFIDVDDASSNLSTHRLVQLATRWWLERETSDLDAWALQALRAIEKHFPNPPSNHTGEELRNCQLLLPHAEILLQHKFRTPDQDTDVTQAKLLRSTGRFIWYGDFKEAQVRFEKSMTICQKYFGERHMETMESTGLYGWTLIHSGDEDKAIALLTQLVEMRREILGLENPKTIDALSDLATAIAGTRDYARAEEMQREALALSERVLGRKHNDTLNCIAHLADALEEQNKISEARPLLREVYESKRELFGPTHPDVLSQQCNLALILTYEEETIPEAFELYQSNLKAWHESYGVDHGGALVTAHNFAELLRKEGRAPEARELCLRSLEGARDGSRKSSSYSQKMIGMIESLLEGLNATVSPLDQSDEEADIEGE
ncbi:short-chain dehydrogenase [Paramyrothecium foliicola]|nr:short-chain dehydrogenase [Paramyrothecium foliicola]